MIENAGRAIPDQAQVVVISGGIVGCSVAGLLVWRYLATKGEAAGPRSSRA